MAKAATTAKAAATPSGKDYVVNWRLDNIQGTVLERGEIVNLDSKMAKPFLECGVISPVGAVRVPTQIADGDLGDTGSSDDPEPPEDFVP